MDKRITSRIITVIVLISSTVAIFGLGVVLYFYNIGPTPVMKVDIAYPTETKPQSKIWYAKGHWWAWLPTKRGSSIWKRENKVWEKVNSGENWLTELPGSADIWADENEVWAVVAGNEQLAFARLTFDDNTRNYKLAGTPVVWSLPIIEGSQYPHSTWAIAPPNRSIESATIARDSNGRLWIAYDYDQNIWMRFSLGIEGDNWSEAFRINKVGEKIGSDDIGLVVTLPDGVGVIWSNQRRHSFLFRKHINDKPGNQWEDEVVVSRRFNEANDHLNAAALTPDGTLLVATKTSIYIPDNPVLSLKVRDISGDWASIPYATLENGRMPSRPIALLSDDSLRMFLVHTSLTDSISRLNRIVLREAKVESIDISTEDRVIIADTLDIRSPTSTKGQLPKDAPWIVLASDRFGHIYEGVLPK